MRYGKFIYVAEDGLWAHVKCTECGWRSSSMPVSPFDPNEALVVAPLKHEKCAKPETLEVD